MITFELSEILNPTGLSSPISEIVEVTNKLSLYTSDYIKKTSDQTIGVKPDTGISIGGLPAVDKTKQSINKVQEVAQDLNNHYAEEIYANAVWQIMVATQILPVGWLYNSVSHPDYALDRLRQSWHYILLGGDGKHPMYRNMSAFGVVAHTISYKKNNELSFFAIYNSEYDRSELQKTITDLGIDNIILMSESEYADNLVNGMNYTFTVRFDCVPSQYQGIIFNAKINLVESVPTYKMTVACSNESVLYRETTTKPRNPHINTVEFKKGSDVSNIIHVPSNYSLYMIVLNGATYFVGTTDMDMAGISILKTDVAVKTGYDTYSITVKNPSKDATLYIAACENFTATESTKNMISANSSLKVTSSDISINLIFNRPFIYFDTSKVKVWAKKNDDLIEEQVTNITFMTDGNKYQERKSVFSDSCKPRDDEKIMFSDRFKHPHELHSDPNIHYSRPFGKPHRPIPPELVSKSFIYGVTECSSVIMTFDGYVNYKYFRVEFEDEAMVATYKLGNGTQDKDVIPYLEEVKFTNDYYDKIVDDDDDNGVNNDGSSDNNTRPDVKLSPSLGLSYDTD